MDQPPNSVETPESQASPPKEDYILRWFLRGIFVGGVIGFGVVLCIELHGKGALFPSVYVAFWALVGGLAGMFAAIFHRWLWH